MVFKYSTESNSNMHSERMIVEYILLKTINGNLLNEVVDCFKVQTCTAHAQRKLIFKLTDIFCITYNIYICQYKHNKIIRL